MKQSENPSVIRARAVLDQGGRCACGAAISSLPDSHRRTHVQLARVTIVAGLPVAECPSCAARNAALRRRARPASGGS